MAIEQLDLFGALQHLTQPLRKLLGGGETAPTAPGSENPPGVRITYSPRLRRGWRARFHRITGHTDLTLPGYMQKNDFAAVRAMICEWAVLANRRKTVRIRERIRELEKKIWSATEQVLADTGDRGLGTQRIPPIRPQGRVHDLDKVLEAVNQTYFKGELRCRITWSGRKGGQSFHTTRVDALTGETVHIISISKGYDHPQCPEYAVAGVVYHECLHIAIPPEMSNGRRIVHGRNFRQREKLYLFYEEWRAWHRDVLPRIVRSLHSAR